MEGENHYLLVITTLIGKLSLGSTGNDLKESSAALPRGDTFQNPCMAAVLSGSTRAVSYRGATVKRGKLTTTFEQGSELMATFGQRGQQMTTSGQKE